MTLVAFIQGVYYLITGLWSIVDIDSFQVVTGPKTDLWLVKTVGVLVIAIGAGLIWAGASAQIGFGMILIAIICATGLAAIDLFYVSKGVLSSVYALDALLEIFFLTWWLWVLTMA